MKPINIVINRHNGDILNDIRTNNMDALDLYLIINTLVRNTHFNIKYNFSGKYAFTSLPKPYYSKIYFSNTHAYKKPSIWKRILNYFRL